MQQTRNKDQKNKGSNIVTNVATLDPKNPIPFEYHNPNIFILKKERRFIPFFEGKDNFAQLLLEAKLLSSTTLACINSKVKYCIGTGLILTDTEKDDKLSDWTRIVNRKGQSFNDIIRIAIDNYLTTGNAYINVVRGKVGSTKFIKVYVPSFLDCRLASPDDYDISESVFISKEFRRKGVWTFKGDEDAIEIPIFLGDSAQKWQKGKSGDEHVIFHVKNEMPGYDYYGMPSNVGSLPQQILEYKCARYNMDNFDNNLVIGGVIALQGTLTKDEANKLGGEIVYQHSGDGKRGRYVILSSESGVVDAKILPFERQKDGDFIKFDERIESKIFLSNEWSKVLIDPHTSGLGNSGKQIQQIFETKNNTVIKPIQAYFLEKMILPIMRICDDWMGTKWSQHQFDIKTVAPLSFAGDLDINAIITKDEGRESIGLAKSKNGKGDEYIKTENNKKETTNVPDK